jgi:hypothetical protein
MVCLSVPCLVGLAFFFGGGAMTGGLFPKGFGQKPIGLKVMATVGGDGGEGVKEGE